MTIKIKRLFFSVVLVLCCGGALHACKSREDTQEQALQRIKDRGTLLVGTTGDYRPLSYREESGAYWGFCIDVAGEIGKALGVSVSYVPTSWPTLSADVTADTPTFDLAIGGITITDARKETMLMSDGYLANGKTILCRASDADKYKSLEDLDRPEVRVMVNPGGLNEKFANENLTHASIIVHQRNEEIPSLVASGEADVMITEITEAPWYVQNDERLAAPLLDKPFTHGEIGVLMRKGQEGLVEVVNSVIARLKADGTLEMLREKYALDYKGKTSEETNMTKLGITVAGKTITAAFEDNSSATAFAEKLATGPVTVSMSDYGNFEKVGSLGFSLPRNDRSINTVPGDIILYQGNQITIYYDTNSWTFTKLAHIPGATTESMKAFLGDGTVPVTFSLVNGQ